MINHSAAIAMKQSFQLSYWLLILLGVCKAFCLINPKERSRVILREHQQSRDDAADDDEDDEDFPDVDISNFKAPRFLSFGLNGRSSPSQRKAIGLSRSSNATIHFCENCGTEYVQWVGRCSTCRQWNTLQSQSVPRRSVDEISRESGKKVLEIIQEEDSLQVDLYPWMEVMQTVEMKNKKEVYIDTFFEYFETNRTLYHGIEGCAMTISGMEPVAIKALVVQGSGLRSAKGIDLVHLCRTLAILQKQFRIDFRLYDVYVECSTQVERRADLALVAAVMSSLSSLPVRADSFLLGEIDLLGHIQPTDERAALSSFSRIVCGVSGDDCNREDQVDWVACRTISQALSQVLVGKLPHLD